MFHDQPKFLTSIVAASISHHICDEERDVIGYRESA